MAETRFAARRFLPRGETKPGRKIPAVTEGLHRGSECGDRGGRDRTDAGNRHEPASDLIFACSSRYLLVELVYPDIQLIQDAEHDAEHVARGRRQRGAKLVF